MTGKITSREAQRPSKVAVLATGGTFDKTYDEVEEKLGFEQSIVPDLINKLFLEEVSYHPVMMIDSADMLTSDQAVLLEAIQDAAQNRIVIVHGTSRILETCEFLRERVSSSSTVVLTGALIPFRYSSAEASANFGAAVAAARYFDPGVYVSMHGLVEPGCKMYKDPDTARFRLINQY